MLFLFFFFFNDTATTEIYTLSLHDALPILARAEKIAENIRTVVKDFRFVWEGKSFELGCSIGLVPITFESVSPTELLSEADAACYAAKEKGRNRVQVFEPGDIELARRHGEMQWVSRINSALRDRKSVV